MIQGHLTIIKESLDGTKEVILDDHNIITTGFGYNIVNLWMGKSLDLEDYRIRYFKVGKSAVSGTNPNFYDVSVGLTYDDYGAYSNVELVLQNQLKLNNTFLSTSSFVTSSNVPFGKIRPDAITSYSGSSLEFYFKLDENTAVGIPIKEIGLFAANPDNEGINKAIMVCYRAMSQVITKNSDFSLHFYWLIGQSQSSV